MCSETCEGSPKHDLLMFIWNLFKAIRITICSQTKEEPGEKFNVQNEVELGEKFRVQREMEFGEKLCDQKEMELGQKFCAQTRWSLVRLIRVHGRVSESASGSDQHTKIQRV